MGDITYAIATSPDTDAIIQFLARRFSESEPPAVAMELSFHEMQGFLQHIVPRILPEQLTIIARAGDKKSLAGVLLTDDFAAPVEVDLNQVSPKFLPILSMLEALDVQYRRRVTVGRGECLHLFMLAVDSAWAGRGIAQKLVRVCLDNGQRKGYRGAVTEATGKISQQVFRKRGFVERFRVEYQQFRYQGKAVFASITDHESAILMERTLG